MPHWYPVSAVVRVGDHFGVGRIPVQSRLLGRREELDGADLPVELRRLESHWRSRAHPGGEQGAGGRAPALGPAR